MSTDDRDHDLLARLYDEDGDLRPRDELSPEERARLEGWAAARTRVREADEAEDLAPKARARLRSRVLAEAARHRPAGWRRWLLGPGTMWASAAAVAAGVLLVVSGPEPERATRVEAPERVEPPARASAAEAPEGAAQGLDDGPKLEEAPEPKAGARPVPRATDAKKRARRSAAPPPQRSATRRQADEAIARGGAEGVGPKDPRVASSESDDRSEARGPAPLGAGAAGNALALDRAAGGDAASPPTSAESEAAAGAASQAPAQVADYGARRAAPPPAEASRAPSDGEERGVSPPVERALRAAARAVAAKRWRDAERALGAAEVKSTTALERRWVWVSRAEAALARGRLRDAARWAQRAALDADDAVTERARVVLRRARSEQGSPISAPEPGSTSTTSDEASD